MSKPTEKDTIDVLALLRESLDYEESGASHVFVIMGASGDLAKKKIYPTLWWLFRDGLLPDKTYFIGYARSNLTMEDVKKKVVPYMKVKEGEEEKVKAFFKVCEYVSGQYDHPKDFSRLNTAIEQKGSCNRLFYLALPPTVFEPVTLNLKALCMSKGNKWTRIICRETFGHDLEFLQPSLSHLSAMFKEEELYED
ncbi:hypothetical protein ScPMuIL_009317 [Solemya velum]